MENLSLFDFLSEEDAAKYKPIKSTDWKWTMANDYPKDKNGLKFDNAVVFYEQDTYHVCEPNTELPSKSEGYIEVTLKAEK